MLTLALNRPERLNAVNLALYEGLEAEIQRAVDASEVRAIILTGTGRSFCVGADLKSHGEQPPTGADRERYADTAQRVNYLVQSCPVPIIAAVNGHAIGAGLELALSADFMIVADDAKLRFPEVALGTFLGGGVTYTLPDRVGVLKARELIYFGEFFKGREAKEMGLANECRPAAQVLSLAKDWAERLAAQAPLSLAAAKSLIGPAGTKDRTDALRLEKEALIRIFGTEDWSEGVAAFNQKRPPNYRGR